MVTNVENHTAGLPSQWKSKLRDQVESHTRKKEARAEKRASKDMDRLADVIVQPASDANPGALPSFTIKQPIAPQPPSAHVPPRMTIRDLRPGVVGLAVLTILLVGFGVSLFAAEAIGFDAEPTAQLPYLVWKNFLVA